MRYVIDAEPGSTLVYGFKADVTAEQVRKSIAEGTIESYLQYIPVKKGDVFFIETGTVHAIGAGCLVYVRSILNKLARVAVGQPLSP